MSVASSLSYDATIGRQVRLLREAAELSQEQVARELRHFGIRWTKATVGKVERGERTLTAPEVWAVADIVDAAVTDVLESTALEQARIDTYAIVQSEEMADMTADEVERRAAQQLGRTPAEVSEAARRLWGRGLADERDARATERQSDPTSAAQRQAVRGHVTRELVRDLRKELWLKGQS